MAIDSTNDEDIPLVRCASLHGYRQLVSSLGGDADLYLKQAGLEGVALDDGERLIPSHCLCNALEIASQDLDVADFGLRLSLSQDLNILGPIAVLLQNASEMSEIANILQRYLHKFHNQSEKLLVSFEKNNICLKYVRHVPRAIGDVQVTLLALGFAARMAQQLIEPAIIAKAIYFMFPQPKDDALYKEIFKSKLYFNQEFSCALIDTNVFRKEYVIKREKIRNIESYLFKDSNLTNNLSQQLRVMISHTLPSAAKGLAFYANQLQMSERTLQRRLSSEGHTFKGLIDQTRKEIAERYIVDKFYTMTQISELLGFSDQAVFTRAFRRWYGVAPKSYVRDSSQ